MAIRSRSLAKRAAMLFVACALVAGGWFVGRADLRNAGPSRELGAVPTDMPLRAPVARAERPERASASTLPKAPDRPLPPGAVPLRDSLAELRRRADAGEGAAACRLAAEMDFCEDNRARLEGEADGLRRAAWIEQAARNATSPQQQQGLRAAQRSMVARGERLLADSEHCEGAPPFSAGERVRYWRRAAQAGNVPAMRQYAVGNAFRLNDSLENLDELRIYRDEAEALAWRAVNAGDLPTTMALARAYSPMHRGGRRYLLAQSIQPDASRALSLFLLLQARMGDGPQLPRGAPNPVAVAIEELEGELSAEATSRARRAADDYARSIPQGKPLSREESMRAIYGSGTRDIDRSQCGPA